MRGFGWLVLLLVLVGVVNQMAVAVPGVTATGNGTALTPVPNGRGSAYLDTTLVNISDTGMQGDGASRRGRLSADGRWVAFSSVANNLTGDWQGPAEDIFLHDRETGVTEPVSVSSLGAANQASEQPDLSANGRYIVFSSVATKLVANDTNDATDVFRKDMETGDLIRLSESEAHEQGNGDSRGASISTDGQIVVFESAAPNLVAGDTNGLPDIFAVTIRDAPMIHTLYLPSVVRD